jgi:hypothetical protein
MNLMARLIGMWRGRDEGSAEEDLELTPGLDREIESGAREREYAEEHEEPE